MTNRKFTDIRDAIADDDFAIIIDQAGNLKALWMPLGDDVAVPKIVCEIIEDNFKISMSKNGPTIH